VPSGGSKPDSFNALSEVMRKAGLPEPAIGSFRLHLGRLQDGEDGMMSEHDIRPVQSLPGAEQFEAFRDAGCAALGRVAAIKLNGGLGTSMGLDRAKSLLPVRDGLSFLDLIALQILHLRERTDAPIPLLLMNSYRTAEDSERVLARYPELHHDDLPLGFLQHRVPKIMKDTRTWADTVDDPELAWCPPGHGDLFTALATSGLLGRLLEAGIEYAFVSNADNLGAVLDTALLGYLEAEGLDFLLEAADRTPADRKGGHLCRLLDGRLGLRESGQCPPQDEAAFQDVSLYRFFNTNNIWLRLSTLHALLAEHGGFLPLPTIVNRKYLDPRDPSSPQVLQLETAMGTAVSFFPNAAAVRVPRSRFSPVKNTNDLLAVRSNAYELTEDSRVVLHRERSAPPVIRLDKCYYKMIDAFESRFPSGPPSLRCCDSLRVVGDVTFGAEVAVEGEVKLHATAASVLPSGSVLRGTVEL